MATYPNNDAAVFRPELTAVYSEYSDDEIASLRGLDILPLCPVDTKTGEYPFFDGADYMRIEDTKRSPEGDYKRISGAHDKKTWRCEENGIEEGVPDEVAAEHARFFSEEIEATKRCKNVILRGQEKRIADLVWNEENITPLALTTPWSSASADPKGDVRAAVKYIRENGFRANTLVITENQLEALDECSAIIERVQYTMAAVGTPLTEQILARFFGIPRVLVVNSLYNAALKGSATRKNYQPIWSDAYALVAQLVLPEQAGSIQNPGLGRTILWTQDSPSNEFIETYYNVDKRRQFVRARHNTSECLQSVDCAILLKNVMSA